MKILITLLIAILLLGQQTVGLAADQPSITIGSLSASPQQRVQLPISLETNGAVLVTLAMDIIYDHSLVENPTIRIGAENAGKTVVTNKLPSGALRVLFYDTDNKPLKSPVIAYFDFTVSATAGKGTRFDVLLDSHTLSAADQSGTDVSPVATHGVVSLF